MLFRAVDEDEGLELIILPSGEPKMNEEERESAVLVREQETQERLDTASAMQERVTQAKAVADDFISAWRRVPEDQRSPRVREAIAKAEALIAREKVPPATPETTGTPKARDEAMRALRAFSRGPTTQVTSKFTGSQSRWTGMEDSGR